MIAVQTALSSGAGFGGESPLDRLQSRSGDARWEELRTRSRVAPERRRIDLDPAPENPEETAPAAPEETAPAAPEPEWVPVATGLPLVDEPAPGRPIEVDPFGVPRGLPTGRGLQQVHDERLPPLAPSAETIFLETEDATGYAPVEPMPSASRKAAQALLRPITAIQPFFDYSPTGEDPCEHLCPPPAGYCPDDPNRLCPQPLELPGTRTAERYFPHLEYYWAASDLYHNPLYFENPALERYGHVHFNDCIEPAYSLARFGAQLVGLPYQIALDAPWRHEYSLGWYRPGDFAPKLVYQPPLNARAAAGAAAAYTGLFLLVP